MTAATDSAAMSPMPGSSPGPRVDLTRMGSLRPLLACLRKIGAPVEDLLESSGIPAALIDEPDSFVPANLVHRLVENSARSQGIADIGAVAAAETLAFDLEFLGPALRRAVTVYDYLQTGARVIGHVASGERFWMTMEKDLVRVHQWRPGRPCIGRVHADVYSLVVTLRTLRDVLGSGWCPTEIDLLATDQRMLGEPGIYGDAVLRQSQTHTSFTMPFALLQRRIPVLSEADPAATLGLMRLVPKLPQTFIEDIEAIVGTLLTAHSLRLEKVAESAGMSTRTLQRRLGECGSTYSEVVHRAQVRLASDMLLHTGMQIQEISATLGYTDPANFTRAFRRTTGLTPQHFRRLH